MNKRIKIVMIVLSILIFGGIGTTKIYAAISQFDVTVNHYTTNKDPFSLKTLKDNDGDNNFYVKATYFSSTGNIAVRSVNRNTPTVRSPYYSLSSGSIGKVQTYAYGSSIPGGVYYYMEADYNNASSDTMNVKGNYTP